MFIPDQASNCIHNQALICFDYNLKEHFGNSR